MRSPKTPPNQNLHPSSPMRSPKTPPNQNVKSYTWGNSPAQGSPALPTILGSQSIASMALKMKGGTIAVKMKEDFAGVAGKPTAEFSTCTPRSKPLSALAAQALDGVIMWRPDFFEPVELALMAPVTSCLRTSITQSSTFMLRAVMSQPMTTIGESKCFVYAERALHRADRQRHASTSMVVAAENYSAAIDRHGRLVIWGRPGWLEQNIAQLDASSLFPPLFLMASKAGAGKGKGLGGGKTFAPLDGMTSVTASRHAVFALTSEGHVMYAVTVRHPVSLQVKAIEMRPLKELTGIKVTQIATRYGQAYAVASNGSVYGWGIKSGDLNRPEHSCSMGFGDINTQLHPRQIPGFGSSIGCTPIRSVATGFVHAIFVSVFGEAYTLGQSKDGRLGITEADMDAASHQAYPGHIVKPAKVTFVGRPAPYIIAAAAGGHHSLFLASNGEVWGCGSARLGALPITTHETAIMQPRPLDKLACFCTSIAAGFSCSFFVGECGRGWFAGKARQTETPFQRPLDHRRGVPWQIPDLKQVVQVSVSMELSLYQWEHVLFARRDGSLFGWGHAGHGEFSTTLNEHSTNDSATSSLRPGIVVDNNRATQNFCNEVLPISKWLDNARNAASMVPSAVAVYRC